MQNPLKIVHLATSEIELSQYLRYLSIAHKSWVNHFNGEMIR